MNKLLTKVAKLALGLSLAAGVGVAIGSKAAEKVEAATGDSYEKVTNASNIANGDHIIFVKQDGSQACGTTQNTNNRTPVNITLTNSKYVKTASDNVQEFTVVAGNTSGQFGFHTGSGYIYSASSSSNNLKTNTTASSTKPSGTSAWTISISSGVATVQNVTNTSYYLAFNGTQYFSQYKSGMSKTTIYKKAAAVAVTGVTVSPTEVTLGVGATQQLTPTISPSDATNKNVSYTSSATGVATVSSSGLITAVAAGNATITVKTADGNKTATCAVTVTAPISVTGVSLNKNSTSIEVGSTETLVATITPNNASNKSINWSTSNANIATVNGGVVTGVSKGDATITATTADGGYTASCAVTITNPSSVTFTAGTDVGTSSGQNDDTITKSGISMHCTSMHDTGDAYRYYKDSVLTFTSTIGNMAKIEFTGSDSSNKISNLGSETAGSLSTNATANTATWTGDASTVSFTLSAQGRASLVAITMKSTEKTVTLDKTEIELFTTNSDGIVVTATVENVASPTYSWAANNANVTLVNANTNAVTIKPNTQSASSSTVTLTVGGTTPNLTASVAVTISLPGPGQTAGTAYTVAQARSAIDAGTGVTGVYATGIVSQIVTAYDSTFHNVSFNISSDGLTTSDQLEAYRCGGADAEFVSVGDTVIVYGDLQKYNSTYEFGSGSQIVSRITPWQFDRLELVEAEDYDNTYYLNDTFSPAGLTVNYIEVNTNTSEERATDVTAEAVFSADLTTLGNEKSMTATFGGHTTNAILYNVIEKPAYDVTFGNGSGSLNVNDATVSGNGWTVTTAGTTSFTPNASYAQIGSGNNPATSITFTKTISGVVTVKEFYIDLGGFKDTAGTVTLQVGSTTVGSGSLNGTNNVTVHATSYGRGTGSSTVLTITITSISKGVKAYGIAYLVKTDAEMVSDFIDVYMHMSHTTNDGSCISEGWYEAAKHEYGRLHDDQKSLFNSDSTYADAKARLIAWAAANGETFDPAAHTFTANSGAKLLATIVGTENTNTIAIIVIISLVSVTAIGGYFFIKRRQEN